MFTRFARSASAAAAHPASASFALLLFFAWLGVVIADNHRTADLLAGGATIATLTIVFLLQHAQYHDTRALHAKIDELILSLEGPRDQFAGIERRAAAELNEMRDESNENGADQGA